MKTGLLIGMGLLDVTGAHADLLVVQDLGGVPISQYVDMSLLPNQQSLNAAAQSLDLQDETIDMSHLLLPQPQKEFSPGLVTKHKVEIKIPMPIFLIGGDAQSIKWLFANAAYLKSIDAFGYIVNVTSVSFIKSIEKQTGLKLAPANFGGLSNFIGTTHYPFLIENGWITQ